MGTTAYPVNHPLAVKLWSKVLLHEALKDTLAGKFMGTGSDSVIQVKDDMKKQAGDRLTIGLRMQLSAAGVQGDSTLEGQEEALATYTDNVFIDQLRHAVRSAGKMSEQRIPFSVREEAMMGLRDWWSDRMDTSFINQVTGNTGQADTRYTGNQAAVAPSTTAGNSRQIFGPDDETTENSLSSASASNNFQLTLIDKAVTYAQTATPFIRPANINGQKKYAVILHPHQVYNLKTDATAARVTWFQTRLAEIQGGKSQTFTNQLLGEYNGTLIFVDSRIPLAPSTTTVRRAVFLGAQAMACGYGRISADEKMDWVEEKFDYGNQLGVSAGMIFGCKKLVYNGIDFASIVLSTHAEAP